MTDASPYKRARIEQEIKWTPELEKALLDEVCLLAALHMCVCIYIYIYIYIYKRSGDRRYIPPLSLDLFSN